ncbi:MAG: hypothetical protein AB7F99_12395, partial [Vicinamibacterales bacterium]
EDRWVKCDGLPYSSPVVPGKEIGKFSLRDGWTDLFGSMTTVMFRSEVVRSTQPFYNESHLYADTEACYKVLQSWDFGFVHQVLTFSRVHPHRLSSFSIAHDTLPLSRLAVTRQFGNHYLEPDEYQACLERTLDRYYHMLGGHLLKGRRAAFWSYHRRALEELGFSFSWPRVVGNACAIVARAVIRPFESVRRAARTIAAGPGRG